MTHRFKRRKPRGIKPYVYVWLKLCTPNLSNEKMMRYTVIHIEDRYQKVTDTLFSLFFFLQCLPLVTNKILD